MTPPKWLRLTAALTILMLSASTDIAAQAAVADVWKMVPALPTTCYRDDDFNDKLSAASVKLQSEVERQAGINTAAREQFDKMDMSEKAQRMQAFMMKNPQQAMKMMQAERAAGASVVSSMEQMEEITKRLEAELTRLQASFGAAAEEAVRPIKAKQKQLIDAKTVLVGEAQISMFTTAADHAQYVKLIDEENAVYEKACAPYFGTGGSFHKWVSSYRTEVVDKLISSGDAGDGALIMQMQAMDLPGGGYRSTVPLEQVNTSLTKLRTIWWVRLPKATPRVDLRK
jgi:hypothetical protein